MSVSNRYAVGGAEGEYEPGSNERVLKNLLGLADPAQMDELELELLGQLYNDVLLHHLPDHAIAVEHIKDWHRRWLGNVYQWAGQERRVSMSKDGFPFAAVPQIPRLLSEFEQNCLRPWTPCHGMTQEALIDAIAVSHVEFILIHPFREGNGRLSRLLSDVMAVQAGHDPLDYSAWDTRKPAYIAGIHAGLAGNYLPMKALVREALERKSPGISVPV